MELNEQVLNAECSTPLGITARGTGQENRVTERGSVLNASRHHGKGD